MNAVAHKTQAVQQAGGAGLGAEAVDRFQALIQFVYVGAVAVTFHFFRRNSGLDFAQLAVAVHYVVQSGTMAVRAFLGHVRNLVLEAEMKVTPVRLKLAQQHRKQGRLATAIGSDQSHPLPGMDLEADAFKQ